MRILYARDRVEQPWKNGGGVTREVMVSPREASFDDFGWRVSIATVQRDGPFSAFAGIDRTIALFEGRMRLAIAGGDTIALSPDSGPLSFAGDAAADATLIEGPVTDLNLMTRRGAFASQMRRQVAGDPFVCTATTLVFPLARAALVSGEELDVQDAVLAEANERIAFGTAAVACYIAEIRSR